MCVIREEEIKNTLVNECIQIDKEGMPLNGYTTTQELENYYKKLTLGEVARIHLGYYILH